MPLLSIGLQPALSANSMWSKLVRGLDERAFTGRAAASLAAFRDLIVKLTDVARREPVSIAIGKMLDQSGYLQDLRDERSEEADGRVENLAELVSAAREYESREQEPTLNAFVDRLSLLSDADEESGTRDARVWMLTLHSAKGLEFPVVILAGLEEGLFPAFSVGRRRGGARGGAAAVLCRDDPRTLAPGAHRRGTTPGIRRIQGERAVTLHRRGAGRSWWIACCRPSLTGYQSTFSHSHYEFKTNPYGRGGRRGGGDRVRESSPTYAYEDEDQSTGMALKLGMKVRHPQFGVGTVLSVEALDDDTKLVVRFTNIGQKTLRAKFARLEPA